QSAFVARTGANGPIEPRNRFDVVVQDIGTGIEHNLQGFVYPLKVGDQNFDAAIWSCPADFANGFRKNAGAAKIVIISIHAGDDGMLKAESSHSFGHAAWLVPIERQRLSLWDGTKTAAASADVAEEHERRRSVVPALSDVGALRGLADG